jgi:hypothetical protein
MSKPKETHNRPYTSCQKLKDRYVTSTCPICDVELIIHRDDTHITATCPNNGQAGKRNYRKHIIEFKFKFNLD